MRILNTANEPIRHTTKKKTNRMKDVMLKIYIRRIARRIVNRETHRSNRIHAHAAYETWESSSHSSAAESCGDAEKIKLPAVSSP